MSGLYIHIPYCASKCIYCDFYSIAKTHPHREEAALWATDYIDAVIRELRERTAVTSIPIDDAPEAGLGYLPADEPLTTIYLGGGTPSILPVTEIHRLLEAIRAEIDTSHVIEVTLEANPEDVTEDFARGIAGTGINRVSMGVQTFDDNELRILRRRHDANRAAEAVAFLRRAGIRNISLDLMYGLPGQTPETFAASIARCLSLDVEHISAYCLSVEEGTLLSRRVARGELRLPDDEACLSFSQRLRSRLKEAGYMQYEISNYARPGYHSRHNSSYWVGTPYLGLGPGAHSFDGQNRRGSNAPDVRAYIRGEHGYEEEHLTPLDRYHELIMLGLRTRIGVSHAELQKHLDANAEIAAHFAKQYRAILAEGLIQQTPDGNIALTERGLNLADDVIRRFFLI